MPSFSLRAGDLDRQVVIEQATKAANSYGELIETWATYATVWARVRESGGNEALIADIEIARRRALFTIRYRADVVETMRLVWSGHNWDIESLRQLGRERGTEILAVARVDG